MEERQRLLEEENDSTAERFVVEALCSVSFHLFAIYLKYFFFSCSHFSISLLYTLESPTLFSLIFLRSCRLRTQEETAEKLKREKKRISDTALHLQANLEVRYAQ